MNDENEYQIDGAGSPVPVEQPVVEPVVTVAESIKQATTTQDYPISNKGKIEGSEEVKLPSETSANMEKCLGNMPNINMNDDPEARVWGQVLTDSIYNITFNDTLVPTTRAPGSDFRQKVDVGGKSFGISMASMTKAENENLKGERALFRVMSHLGMGSIFQVPLWHSGMWLSFKPPTESEIVELNRLIIADKINLGRNSYGLIYSNTTVYAVGRLVDFALSHVYDITVKRDDIDVGNLKDHISCQDIFSLLWGFTCTMYPRGFNFSRACVNDPSKCNHVVEEILNVSKLQWTNNSGLTEWQKTHMSSRQPRLKDMASVKRYKDELLKSQNSTVDIEGENGQTIRITLKTPNITQYVDAGHRWIGSIVDTVNSSVGTNLDKNERDKFIFDKGKASSMRQYAHWVNSIELDTNIIDDVETIEKVLDSLSASDKLRNSFLTKVVDYINNSTISVIGIPVFECPKCGMEQAPEKPYPKVTDIIPIDVIQVFFELTAQRLGRIADR